MTTADQAKLDATAAHDAAELAKANAALAKLAQEKADAVTAEAAKNQGT